MQAALTAAGLTFLVGLVLGRDADLLTVLAASLVAGITGRFVAHVLGPTLPFMQSQAPLAIVPWGVVVESDLSPRVLRWAAVRDINVEFVHEMDHATPSTRWSVVTIRTERELFGGRVRGGVSLERLEAHFSSYADEAARPLSLDLDGQVPLDDWLEPSFELLLAEARRLLRAGELGERLSLSPGGYREPSGARPSSEAVAQLEHVLAGSFESPADPRPLATLIAAELGASELIPAVVALVTSPHPLVAAIARAAALRLGADVKRVGSVDELEEFVPGGELDLIREWLAFDRAA